LPSFPFFHSFISIFVTLGRNFTLHPLFSLQTQSVTAQLHFASSLYFADAKCDGTMEERIALSNAGSMQHSKSAFAR